MSPFGIKEDATTFEALSDNSILNADTTLYCLTENKDIPNVIWSYVDNAGTKSNLTSTTDSNTGVSTLYITTDVPGTYSCLVTQDGGGSRVYAVEMVNISLYTGCITSNNYGSALTLYTE